MHSVNVESFIETPFIISITALPFNESACEENKTLVGQLFRTRRPDAALVNFEALKIRNITHIINLLSTREENEVLNSDLSDNKYLYLPDIYEREGFSMLSFPIPDFGTPGKEELAKFLDRIIEKLAEGENLAIHCRSGCGRTGLVVACLAGKVFRLLGKAAILWVQKQIPGAVDTSEQEEFVCDFLKNAISPKEALEKVSLMDNKPLWQIVTLLDLVEIKIEKGELFEGLEILTQAKAIAQSITKPQERVSALFRIFELEKKGDLGEAMDTLSQIWTLIADYKGSSEKARAYLRLAREERRMGSEKVFQMTMQDVVNASKEVQNEKIRANLFFDIAKEYKTYHLEKMMYYINQFITLNLSKADAFNKVIACLKALTLYEEEQRSEFLSASGPVIQTALNELSIEELGPMVKSLSNYAKEIGKEASSVLLGYAETLFTLIKDQSSRDEADYYLRKAKIR